MDYMDISKKYEKDKMVHLQCCKCKSYLEHLNKASDLSNFNFTL